MTERTTNDPELDQEAIARVARPSTMPPPAALAPSDEGEDDGKLDLRALASSMAPPAPAEANGSHASLPPAAAVPSEITEGRLSDAEANAKAEEARAEAAKADAVKAEAEAKKAEAEAKKAEADAKAAEADEVRVRRAGQGWRLATGTLTVIDPADAERSAAELRDVITGDLSIARLQLGAGGRGGGLQAGNSLGAAAALLGGTPLP